MPTPQARALALEEGLRRVASHADKIAGALWHGSSLYIRMQAGLALTLVASSPQWRSRDLQTAMLARCFVIICIQLAGFTCTGKIF